MVFMKKRNFTPLKRNFTPLIYYFPFDHGEVFAQAARGEFSFFFPIRAGTYLQARKNLRWGPAVPLDSTRFFLLDIAECNELVDWYLDHCPRTTTDIEQGRFIFMHAGVAWRYEPEPDVMHAVTMPDRRMLFIDPADRVVRMVLNSVPTETDVNEAFTTPPVEPVVPANGSAAVEVAPSPTVVSTEPEKVPTTPPPQGDTPDPLAVESTAAQGQLPFSGIIHGVK